MLFNGRKRGGILQSIYVTLRNITGGICHSTYRYAKANNKYMKDFDKSK